MTTPPTFIHLNAHSSFSLLEGIPTVKALAKRAAELKMPALGITETGNLFSAVEASKHLWDAGVQPILGTQLGIARGKDERGAPLPPGHLTLLVQNEEGWKNLVQLSSRAFLEAPEGEPAQIPLQEVCAHTGGLICLTGNLRESPVTLPILRKGDLETARSTLQELAVAFGDHLYVELQRHGLPEEQKLEPCLLDLAEELSLPVVATNDPRFLTEDEYNAFRVMLAIGDGITLNEPPRRSFSSAHTFKTAEEMAELFADLPQALENTVHIARRCAYKVPTGINYMPAWKWHALPGEEVPSAASDTPPTKEEVDVLLKRAAELGLAKRLEEHVFTAAMSEAEKAAKQQEYEERLAMELGVITNMGYAGYFLITSDFILFAKKNGIPVGPGRGSGAGSLVAWVLEITDLDPIAWGLYFERFLNPDRVSLPDFDIDFCQERRDEVIAYVREKYGHGSVSQIITFGTLKARACIRDVGRVLGMSFGQVGQIAAFIPEGPASIPVAQALAEDDRLKTLYDTDDDVRQLLDVAMQLEGCYRHASTHAAGVIIADRPITEVCPLYKDPRSDMPATQLSMFDAEYAGLVKFDFLGLKTLTTIRYATRFIEGTGGGKVDVSHLSLEDPPTFELLREGTTIGVFQVESRGMTEYLKKIVPDKMQYLSDVIALYRPGPLGSGMADDFIECRHGRKDAHYPHPVLKPVLEETFGVPVYQEQVMRMAQELAGYTLGGADLLRRAMGKKKPEEMAKQRAIFVEGAAKTHKVPEQQANAIFDLMEKFASYGFNKAHTVAYALIAYQTAWLKANHPAEFMAASMTMDRGNSDKVMKFKQELDRMALPLLPPCVNHSDLIFRVEKAQNAPAVRFALGAVKGAGDEAMRALVAERVENGPYTDIFNFMERQNPKHINRRQLEVLIKSGALDALKTDRAKLFHNVEMLLGHMQSSYEERTGNQCSLFGGGGENALSRPVLAASPPWDMFEKLAHEQQAIGFYLSAHPLESFGETLTAMGGVRKIADIPPLAERGGGLVKIAALISAKKERKTKTGKRMAILGISDPSGQEEIAVFPEQYDQYYDLLEKNRPLLFTLQISMDEDRLRINAERVEDLERATPARECLTLRLKNTDPLPRLRELLSGQPQGPTVCEILYSQPQMGEVRVRLKERLEVPAQFIATLETLPDVSIIQ